MSLKTRKPTGRVPWPLILVEGSEKSGKSWMCAELSASPKVGRTFWIDLGEGTADEYGAIPNVRYEIVEHDGSYGSLFEAVCDVRDVAAKAQANGDLPTVLVVDSMTSEWELLSAIADRRARERAAKRGRRLGAEEEPQIGTDLWNQANARHRKLMTMLMTFPGIAVMTARGKDTVLMGSDGKPVEGRRSYKVEGQKHLAFDAAVWIRLSREDPPTVVGCRAVRGGIRPGVDRPRTMPNLSLEHVVFDVLGCTPGTADVRSLINGKVTDADLSEYDADKLAVIELAITAARNEPELRKAHGLIGPAVEKGEISPDDGDRLFALVRARKGEMTPQEPLPPSSDKPTTKQLARLHATCGELGIERPDRLALMSRVADREIRSANDLTAAELEKVFAELDRTKAGMSS